jgi:hypothetical protein
MWPMFLPQLPSDIPRRSQVVVAVPTRTTRCFRAASGLVHGTTVFSGAFPWNINGAFVTCSEISSYQPGLGKWELRANFSSASHS